MGEIKKILIVGLDQAGKTSILNILQQKYNKMDNIKPTMGIERDQIEVFGFPIVTWDLGGQEKYRQNYLQNIKNFEGADSIFFVIDAVNATRYDEALHYFMDILEILEKISSKPKLVLCIHKIDPNIKNDPETTVAIEEVKNLFVSVGYNLSIYVTSIYDRRSIVEAFSKTFQDLISNLQPIKHLLESIVLLLKLDAAILFDENLMILNEYYRTKEIEEVCLTTVYNSIHYMTNINPKLSEEIVKNFELVLNIKSYTKHFNFIEVIIKGWQMYLLTMGEETLDNEAVLSKFSSMSHIFEQKKW